MRIKNSTRIEDGMIVADPQSISSSREVTLAQAQRGPGLEVLVDQMLQVFRSEVELAGVDLAHQPQVVVRLEVRTEGYLRPEEYWEWTDSQRAQWAQGVEYFGKEGKPLMLTLPVDGTEGNFGIEENR